MTDFKAPPVPPKFDNEASIRKEQEAPVAPTVVSETNQQNSSFASGHTNPQTDMKQDFSEWKEKVNSFKEKFKALPTTKQQVIVLAGAFLFGLLVGAVMFSGGDEVPVVAPAKLQGVISNPDIKENLKRCGQVSPSSPCVLYVMNSYDYEKLAKDFFETAVALTRRKDFVISMDNVHYGTMRIPPGYFAQIKIPALR